MGARENFKTVQRAARQDVKVKLSGAGRLDLWGLEIKPSPQIVASASVNCGFSLSDTRKLVFLLGETLSVRAL